MSKDLKKLLDFGHNARNSYKLRAFTDFAMSLSKLSTCKRLQVGCVILSEGFSQVFSIGYNGVPSGVDNDSCREEKGNCGCIHAEANALVKLKTTQTGLWLLSTTCPCEHCAGLIVNSKSIDVVLYINTYRIEKGLNLLRDCGITTVAISEGD